MNKKQLIVNRVWTDNNAVYAETTDGQIASYAFAQWKRLAKANPSERNNFYLSYTGIHWEEIDEDLSFEGMFCEAGICSRTASEDSVCYLKN